MGADPDKGKRDEDKSEKNRRLAFLENFQISQDAKEQWAGLGLSVDGKASAKELESNVNKDNEAQKLRDHLQKKRDAELARLTADNDRRRWFFNFVLVVAGLPVAVASVAMGVLVWRGETTDAIVVAFFASVVIEVIGLAVIVARYLFPNGGSIAGEPDDDTERK